MSSSPLLLALELSTTSLRALIFDQEGQTLAATRVSLPVLHPEVGAYEQDASSWWLAAQQAIHQALTLLPPARRGDLVTLSVTHPRETVVLTDPAGQPLAPALLWMDQRCTAEVAQAERKLGAVRLHALSGTPPCTTPSLYKLMYLRSQNPEWLRGAQVHDVHSFLSLLFTGRAVTSLASASPTGLVDMRQKSWSPTLLDLAGLSLTQMPEFVEAGHLIGPLLPEVAQKLGLPEHLLVYAGAADSQAAGLGAGVIHQGPAFFDLGTAVTCGALTHRYQVDQAFRTLHSAIPGYYGVETTLQGGMQTLWWFVQTLLRSPHRDTSLAQLETEAASIPSTSDGLLALPYWAGSMNPHWDDQVGGGFLGLRSSHQPVHLYRALLEGIAYEQRLHLEGIEIALGKPQEKLFLLGGGSRSDLWCQILADVLGRPLFRVEASEASALGVALLAAVSHGLYPQWDTAAAAMTRSQQCFSPGPARATYDRLYREVYRGLYAELRHRLQTLAQFRSSAEDFPQSSGPS